MVFYKFLKRFPQAAIVGAFAAIIYLSTTPIALYTASVTERSAFCGVSALVPQIETADTTASLENDKTTSSSASKIFDFFEKKTEQSAEEKALETTFNGYDAVSLERQTLVNTAESFEGKIPYKWGAKMVASSSFNPELSGLDCSGFVQYIYYLTTGNLQPNLGSTLAISNHYTEISSDELKPGDLGLIRFDGSYYTVGSSETKYYEESDAKAYIKKYNQDLRDNSWEEVEVTEPEDVTLYYQVTYDENGNEISRTRLEESEVDKSSALDEDATNIVSFISSHYNSAPEEPEASPIEGSEDIPDETPEDTPSAEEPSTASTESKTYTITTKRTEKFDVTHIEKVSTLNEDDLLEEDDISLHSNHVGIYVGLDENGNQIWCHCTGKSNGNTVVIGTYPGFKYFVRIMD